VLNWYPVPRTQRLSTEGDATLGATGTGRVPQEEITPGRHFPPVISASPPGQCHQSSSSASVYARGGLGQPPGAHRALVPILWRPPPLALLLEIPRVLSGSLASQDASRGVVYYLRCNEGRVCPLTCSRVQN